MRDRHKRMSCRWRVGSFGPAVLLFLLLASALASAADGSHGGHPSSTPLYEVFVSADPSEPVRFRVYLPDEAQGPKVHFPWTDGDGVRPAQVVSVLAFDNEGHAIPILRSRDGYSAVSDSPISHVDYELSLHPSITKPDTWPTNHPSALRWDDYAYIVGDTFLRWHDAAPVPAIVRFHLPTGWSVHVAGGAAAHHGPNTVYIDDLNDAALLLGPDLSPVAADEGVRVLRIGALPWSDEELLDSLSRMLTPLKERQLATPADIYEFVIARYPGALRFNPFIGSRVIGRQTFIQWVGVGSKEWWHKHTAADIVDFLVQHTLKLAREASWFRQGLANYAGLLLLYEAELLDLDGMYQSLRNMFATGAYYSGPLWPSLLVAGLSEEMSHDAKRVLQFRSPIVAFLFDVELRERSGGDVTLLDWWATLAEDQRRQRDRLLHNEDLLPPVHTFGDMSAFIRDHVFDSDNPDVLFENFFERWIAFQR